MPRGTAELPPADVADAPEPPAGTIPVDRRRHGRRGWILLAIAAWNVWLWATRLVNMVGDAETQSTGFVVVHVVLFAVSLALALVVAAIGWRVVREARTTVAGR